MLITDGKSLYDLVNKIATPNRQEWRTTIEVMLIKQQSNAPTDCRWISTAILLADCLTLRSQGRCLAWESFGFMTTAVRSKKIPTESSALDGSMPFDSFIRKREHSQCEFDQSTTDRRPSNEPVDQTSNHDVWLKARRTGQLGRTVEKPVRGKGGGPLVFRLGRCP